ncbi:virulence factor TspB C-terminal domain-related protein [Pseudomonas sp. PDM20]|uniref:virulence factor TspB C-terminal domain-related protein n=1 Tax=Pseudomonas sp. PDM20 TaxID=2769254 RepID=UPI00178546EA|nr:virulence factor TspB C-terminal domain-related protein [Pseudomonas sp. PDM20]MBD9683833.1 hypothetical protein [Pseudomonas sp. PDM20]MBD9683845.1 hypothetical protein [Pseudomonas sp. PDM20]
MGRFLVGLLLVLSASFASAEDYYWKNSPAPGGGVFTASSPGAVCDAIVASLASENARNASLTRSSDEVFYCNFVWSAANTASVLIGRLGSGCPEGYTYNAETGVCVPPDPSKCESTIGQVVQHQHKRGVLSQGGVILQNTLAEPPGVVCSNSCQYASMGEGPTDCYRFVGAGADQDSAFCLFRYKGNGVECKTDDTTMTTPPKDLSPSSQKKNECTNKTTDAEGRVHYSCLATDGFQEPGKMQCGEVNGVYGCVAGKPSPQKKSTDTKTETLETPASDGSKTTETTTTTTVTTCNGVNACTSTTTVNNTSGKTNSDGSNGGETSTCTGAGCKPAGEEEGEEEEEDKDEVTGDQCGQPLSCSGDVIQCAILKQQKQSRCDWNYEDAKAGIESELAKDEYQVTEDEHDMSGLFQQAIGASRWLPSACPAPERGSLHTRGAGSVQLSWQPTCDFASGVGPFLVAAASIFFAVYVGRGIGGGA